MEKCNVTIQIPAITARWLREYLVSPASNTSAEDELQKTILLTILSSAIGGNHEPSNSHS